jgi:hypothetical protein
VAIIQSNYIPWKGYFDIINDSDIFIFLDDVQYTKNDWRNRNKIKTTQGLKWLTIPVGSNINRLISEVELNNDVWQKDHWAKLESSYGNAKYFEMYKDLFKEIYLAQKWESLSQLNQFIIKLISKEILGIKSQFINSSDLKGVGKKQDKVINLIQAVSGDVYISGPAARNYNDDQLFVDEGIELIYKDYSNYPEYEQFIPPFEHGVTILDLIFHKGPESPYYIWGWRDK